MAKLGTKQKPAVVRVQTQERASEILKKCNENGWQVIVGIEPDNEEDISNVNKFLGLTDENTKTVYNVEKVGCNDPCPCGSGKKYKRCCGL